MIRIIVGQAVIDQMCKISFLIDNSRNVWLLKIQFLSFVSQTICSRMLMPFRKNVDSFEIAQKTQSILVWGAVPHELNY